MKISFDCAAPTAHACVTAIAPPASAGHSQRPHVRGGTPRGAPRLANDIWRRLAYNPGMAVETKLLVVSDPEMGRAGQAVRALTGLSHSRVRGLFDAGCVTVEGRPCGDVGAVVSAGQRVEVRYDPGQGYREKKRPWVDPGLVILHEDEQLIVVDKPAHMLTVPTERGEGGRTLVDRVTAYLEHGRPGRQALVVQRLDRGVSGVLVFAKTQMAWDALRDQFAERKPERLYVALVHGVVTPAEGTYKSHMVTGDNLDRYSTREPGMGELAITHYRVVKALADATAVEVRLETGRRNQIRVHFAEHGHPILGDPRYARERAHHPEWVERRMALHARTLGFVHPKTGARMLFESPLPRGMQRMMEDK
jgi:23S rRNA pseudouridine1911/1915/1917 synthase